MKLFLENDFEKKIKELNCNFNELHLLKKNIQYNYEYLSLPGILSKQFPKIENEIYRRKKLEYIFNHILVLLKEKFIEKEEEQSKKLLLFLN